MATTLEKIAEFLKSRNLAHKVDEEDGVILTGFRTREYADPEGEKRIGLVIRISEEGGYFSLFAPRAYSYKEGPNQLALYQVLVAIQYETKMIQFEYDVTDGEVRPIIEFPLEDAELTEKQFFRCLDSMMGIMETYHEKIQAAITAGTMWSTQRLPGSLGVLGEATPSEVSALLEEIRRRGGGGGAKPKGGAGEVEEEVPTHL